MELIKTTKVVLAEHELLALKTMTEIKCRGISCSECPFCTDTGCVISDLYVIYHKIERSDNGAQTK